MMASEGSAAQYSSLLLDYVGIKMNELIPCLLFGQSGHEYYLTKLLGEMMQLKFDGFLVEVFASPATT
jgi:hypothetical protein